MDAKAKVSGFLSKSNENRVASEWAYDKSQFCVAASRYYYALRFAAMALYAHFDWEIPKVDKKPHEAFIRDISKKLTDIDADIERYFNDAKLIRVTGDYKDFPVKKFKIDQVREDSQHLFEKIKEKIYERK